MDLKSLLILLLFAWILANITIRMFFTIGIKILTAQLNRVARKSDPECFLFEHDDYYLYEPNNGIITYMHGGAFVGGNATSQFLSKLANYAKCRIYSIRYGLAPFYKFPSPIEQFLLVGGRIVNQHERRQKLKKVPSIYFMGDSAGAFHVIQTWLAIKSAVWQNRISSEIGVPVNLKPKGLILLSPYIDVNDSSVSGYSFPTIYHNILDLYGPLHNSFAHHLFRLNVECKNEYFYIWW